MTTLRRHLPGVSTTLAAAALLAVLPFELSAYHTALVAQVGLFFVAILGLNILTGYSGQISIGHGAFMAIGGYTTAILSRDHHMSLVLTMVVAFAVCFAFGLLLGLPALRLSGVYLALATFALAVSVPQIALKFDHFLGGSNGVQSHTTVSHRWLYAASWTTAAILFVAAWFLLRGRIGRAFRAIRDSEVAATSSGITLPIYKTLAFGISAAYAGVAGSLFVMGTNGFAQPNEFDVVLSLQLLVGAAVAGLGSLWGLPVGAAFVALLPTISKDVPLLGSAHGQDVVFGLLVVLVMLLLPQGFAGFLGTLARLRARARAGTT